MQSSAISGLEMDVSLVVSTRNRAEQLSGALRYFDRISAKASWEVIFVNNGSTDATANILTEFAQTSANNVTLVDEPIPGLSAARNAGCRHAFGNVVAFTDDDCYPHQPTSTRFSSAFRKTRSASSVEGSCCSTRKIRRSRSRRSRNESRFPRAHSSHPA